MPLTVAAPNEKRAVCSDAFVDQPVMTTAPVDPLSVAVPSYRVPVQFATMEPDAPLAGMHASVRFTCCAVMVPSTWTRFPQLVCTAPEDGEKPWLLNPALPPHALVLRNDGN